MGWTLTSELSGHHAKSVRCLAVSVSECRPRPWRCSRTATPTSLCNRTRAVHSLTGRLRSEARPLGGLRLVHGQVAGNWVSSLDEEERGSSESAIRSATVMTAQPRSSNWDGRDSRCRAVAHTAGRRVPGQVSMPDSLIRSSTLLAERLLGLQSIHCLQLSASTEPR